MALKGIYFFSFKLVFIQKRFLLCFSSYTHFRNEETEVWGDKLSCRGLSWCSSNSDLLRTLCMVFPVSNSITEEEEIHKQTVLVPSIPRNLLYI
jgi:hypothetical protein